MIGLLDLDLLTNSTLNKLYYPNLEIMKLATYYIQEERQFCRLLSLNEDNLSAYDKIYVCSEITTAVPTNFKNAKNVIYGGAAFSPEGYKTIDNIIIDYTIPRTFIYKSFLQDKLIIGFNPKEIDKFLDNSYIRWYAGDKKLPLSPIKKRKQVILYDTDFFYPDWKELLAEINKNSPSNIIRIHPIRCNKISNFFDLLDVSSFARANEIILDLDIHYDEFNYLFKKYKNKLLANINFNSNVKIPLGGDLKTNTNYFLNLIYTLNTLYSFWSQGIPIKIYFTRPSIGFNNPIQNLCEVIENHCNLSTKYKLEHSIYDTLIKWKKNQLAKNEYDFFLRFYPTSKDLFTQNFNDLRRKKLWRI